MTTRLHTAVFEWLTARHPDREPLYGDLFEEVERGRSNLWLLKQLAYATTASASRDAWVARRTIAERLTLGAAMLALVLFASYVTVMLGVLSASLIWANL
jgi:hypothetical protein